MTDIELAAEKAKYFVSPFITFDVVSEIGMDLVDSWKATMIMFGLREPSAYSFEIKLF